MRSNGNKQMLLRIGAARRARVFGRYHRAIPPLTVWNKVGHAMHEEHKVEIALKEDAERLSAKHNDAPIIVIVGGDSGANRPRTMTSSNIKGADVRLRDLIGILQTAIQIERWKHFKTWH